MKIEFDAESHIGMIRPNNEDMILLDQEFIRDGALQTSIRIKAKNCFCAMIADGMGGHDKGEYASEMVLKMFRDFIHSLPPDLESQELQQRLDQWTVDTHIAVNEKGIEINGNSGMGTTLAGCFVYERKLFWINIGDSRVYIYRDGILRQITVDHTLSNLMEDSNIPSNVIYNCFGGGGEEVFIDMDEIPYYPDDRFLVCSDGLSDMLGDSMIQDLLQKGASASTFVARANDAGGIDNISLILMTFVD